MTDILKPPALHHGDTIGLFAPAGPIPTPEILSEGIEIIKNMGFKIKYSPDILTQTDYLAGSDERRIEEFKTLFQDKDVKAMLAVRGGYGSIRVLNQIDMEAIKNNPKIIIGFSDLTVLLNGIQAKTSLLTFHGPMLSTIVRDKGAASPSLFSILQNPNIEEITSQNIKIIRPGTTSGRLMGGNLTNLVHLIGTSFEPDWHNTILILEDINEPAYKIDRMLTHLKMTGRLSKAKGILLGGFLGADGKEIQDMKLVTNRIVELTENSVPVWTHFPISHGPENRVVPLGAEAVIDSDTRSVSFPTSCLQW